MILCTFDQLNKVHTAVRGPLPEPRQYHYPDQLKSPNSSIVHRTILHWLLLIAVFWKTEWLSSIRCCSCEEKFFCFVVWLHWIFIHIGVCDNQAFETQLREPLKDIKLPVREFRQTDWDVCAVNVVVDRPTHFIYSLLCKRSMASSTCKLGVARLRRKSWRKRLLFGTNLFNSCHLCIAVTSRSKQYTALANQQCRLSYLLFMRTENLIVIGIIYCVQRMIFLFL